MFLGIGNDAPAKICLRRCSKDFCVLSPDANLIHAKEDYVARKSKTILKT